MILILQQIVRDFNIKEKRYAMLTVHLYLYIEYTNTFHHMIFSWPYTSFVMSLYIHHRLDVKVLCKHTFTSMTRYVTICYTLS